MAGIRVRMITGDNKITAKAIGSQCGIFKKGKSNIMEGKEFMECIGGLKKEEKDGKIIEKIKNIEKFKEII